MKKMMLTCCLLLTLETCFAAFFTVNYNGDDLSDPEPNDGVCETAFGNGQCTLRAAIESANQTPDGPHTVNVPYLENDSYPVWAESGLTVYAQMTIRGTGNGRAVIAGDLFLSDGMLIVTERATIKNLEFRPGTTGVVGTYGLRIDSPNTVFVEDVTIIPGADGINQGLYISGGLAVCTRCEIRDGQSLGVRIAGAGNPNLTLINSRVSNNINSQESDGGGILLDFGQLTIVDSLIDNNQALGSAPNFFGSGGGIYSRQFGTKLQIINSTISQNKANYDGGGILAQGETRLENVTITQNSANFNNNGSGTGGGIYMNDFTVITAKNSIIHGNFLPCPTGVPFCIPAGRNCDDAVPDVNIGIQSLGWVMTGNDENCPVTDLTGEPNYTSSAIPKLGPLTLLGGLHPVHPITGEGVEADGGNPDGCTFQIDTGSALVDLPLTLDQRGMSRPQDSDSNIFDGNSCDIGAYEAKCFGDDPDGDYVGSQCDVCPNDFDPLQEDGNEDGIGDACSGDLIFFSGFD